VDDRRGTRVGRIPVVLISHTEACFRVQWDNEVHLPSPSMTEVMAWYSGMMALKVSQWSPWRSPFKVMTEALLCTHSAQADDCGQCRRCSNLRSRQMFWIPKSLTPKPPNSRGLQTFVQATRHPAGDESPDLSPTKEKLSFSYPLRAQRTQVTAASSSSK